MPLFFLFSVSLTYLSRHRTPHLLRYQVVQVSGQHGTGKTILIKTLSAIIDPLKDAQTSGSPKGLDLAVMAFAQFVIALENLSSISPELSDDLCRLSTGSGIRTRKLYTNFEQAKFSFCRPAIIDGISENIHAPDLLDRTILLRTARMDGSERREERELKKVFREKHPLILGALLDIVAHGLNSDAQDDYSPRMLDSYRFMYRCATAMPYGAGGFKQAYRRKQAENKTAAFESSPIAAYFIKWIEVEARRGAVSLPFRGRKKGGGICLVPTFLP